MIDKFFSFAKTFFKEAGLPEPVRDDSAIVTVKFDDFMINLTFIPDQEAVLFYAIVGSIPNSKEAYVMLLEMNNMFEETNCCTLGIFEDKISLQLLLSLKTLEVEEFLEKSSIYFSKVSEFLEKFSKPETFIQGAKNNTTKTEDAFLHRDALRV